MAIRYMNKIMGLSLVALLATTTHAEAAIVAGGMVGDVLNNITTSLGNFPLLASAAAYLLGILYAIQGVFLFKDHVDGGSGIMRAPVPISAGVKRFLAGGMLFSLPFMSKAVTGSLAGAGLAGINTGTATAATGGGMDKMIVDFIGNISGPASFLLMAFAYISAIILLVTAIVRLTHTSQEGPRGPTGLGTIMTFVASGALFSLGGMMGTFSNSLFGSTTIITYPTFSPTVLTGADAALVAPVIQSVMTFIMIVGFIAFMRGWFVLKAFADGNSQVSIAQALTFLMGGAMAINLGALVNALELTVGVKAITF